MKITECSNTSEFAGRFYAHWEALFEEGMKFYDTEFSQARFIRFQDTRVLISKASKQDPAAAVALMDTALRVVLEGQSFEERALAHWEAVVERSDELNASVDDRREWIQGWIRERSYLHPDTQARLAAEASEGVRV